MGDGDFDFDGPAAWTAEMGLGDLLTAVVWRDGRRWWTPWKGFEVIGKWEWRRDFEKAIDGAV